MSRVRSYVFRAERPSINPVRLPHSEISGSKRICRYPKLIAAYHVLLRLLAPRHPSCALCSLINLILMSAELFSSTPWESLCFLTQDPSALFYNAINDIFGTLSYRKEGTKAWDQLQSCTFLLTLMCSCQRTGLHCCAARQLGSAE